MDAYRFYSRCCYNIVPVAAYDKRDKLCFSGEAMLPKIRSDLTVQHVGDELLVLDLQSGQIHQLNATAAWILEKCNGEMSIEAIAKDFAEHFSLDSGTATSDVTATIEQLNRVNVIAFD